MPEITASEKYLNCQRSPKTDYDLLIEKRSIWEPRFWPKVRKTDGCWYWVAAKNNSGYGVFGAYKIGYKKTKFEYAHRVSFVIYKGEILSGMVVDHKCGNHACVNPAHLHLITHSENCAQGSRRRARVSCPKCGEQKTLDSRGQKYCKPCARIRIEACRRRRRNRHKQVRVPSGAP